MSCFTFAGKEGYGATTGITDMRYAHERRTNAEGVPYKQPLAVGTTAENDAIRRSYSAEYGYACNQNTYQNKGKKWQRKELLESP